MTHSQGGDVLSKYNRYLGDCNNTFMIDNFFPLIKSICFAFDSK